MIRALITIGDPAGIGPEISLKAVNDLLESNLNFIPILVGDISVIMKVKEHLMIKRDILPWNFKEDHEKIFFIDVKVIGNKKFPEGKNSTLTGRASFEYLKKAWNLLQNDTGNCLITAPISKTAWNKAGIKFKGHTEVLSYFSKEKTYMLMVAGKLKVLLATVHIPLRKIWHYLTQKELFLSAKTTAEFVSKFFGIKDVRIGFCGINPHAGESGNIGTEEIIIIKPVIEQLKKYGFNASGPYPADTIFRNPDFDFIVSMYHDQALPVLKSLFFERLVNITVNSSGWIRTSPGHGTAFDIAWKNKADASAMKQAIKTAVRMVKRKIWTHS